MVSLRPRLSRRGEALAFSEALARFLEQRPLDSAPFRVGHWLTSLTDESLQALDELGAQFDDGDSSPATDDLLTLIATATDAEAGTPQVQLDPKAMLRGIDLLRLCVQVEDCRRRGWLEITQPLCLDLHRPGEVRLLGDDRQAVSDVVDLLKRRQILVH